MERMLEPLKDVADRFLAITQQYPDIIAQDLSRLNAELVRLHHDLSFYRNGVLEAYDLLKRLTRQSQGDERSTPSSSSDLTTNADLMMESCHPSIESVCKCDELQTRCNLLEEQVSKQTSLLLEKEEEAKRLRQELATLCKCNGEHVCASYTSPTIDSTTIIIEPKPLRRIGASVRSSYLAECDSVS